MISIFNVMVKLTIVIPTYNRSGKLSFLLSSLLNQSLSKSEYRIIVVDDFSTDDTIILLKEYKKKNKIISYYKLKKSFGAGYARNKGIEQVKEGYIIFMDDDCVAYKDVLKKIGLFLEKYPFIKCFGGNIKSSKDSNLIDKYINYGLSGRYNKKYHIYDDLYQVDSIPTCFAVYHRSLFDLKYNKNRIRFKNLERYEENELNYRLSKLDIKFYYAPQIKCIHDIGNKNLVGLFERKKKAGIAEGIIKKIYPDYPIRIPDNFKNFMLFILNIFYKPFSIIGKTELKYLIPFMFFSLIHQIAYNYGIYAAKTIKSIIKYENK